AIERFDWVLGRGGPNRMQSILVIDGKDRLAAPGFARPLRRIRSTDHYAVRNAALDIPSAVLPMGLWQDLASDRLRFPAAAAIGTKANASEKKAGRRVERRRQRIRLNAIAATVAILLSCGAAAMFAMRVHTAEALISGVEVAAIDLHHAIAAA